MRFLGISDNINFPSFICSNSEHELKEEEQINNQWALILNKKDSSNLRTTAGADITFLKNLIFIFFSDLFKMLYSMPATMRTLCRLMYNELFKKIEKRKICLSVVGNFVIGYWMMSALKVGDTLSESTKISDFTNQNAETLKKIVMGIIHNDFSEIDQEFKS